MPPRNDGPARVMVGRAGFEPAATGPRDQCSTRLSYRPMAIPRTRYGGVMIGSSPTFFGWGAKSPEDPAPVSKWRISAVSVQRFVYPNSYFRPCCESTDSLNPSEFAGQSGAEAHVRLARNGPGVGHFTNEAQSCGADARATPHEIADHHQVEAR